MFIDLYPMIVGGPARKLHISRVARARYEVDHDLFGIRGALLFADLSAARRLAERMNKVRDARRYPELAVRGGEIFAAGLIHELQHLVIESLRNSTQKDPLDEVIADITGTDAGVRPGAAEDDRATAAAGQEDLEKLLAQFVEHFPTVEVESGEVAAEAYLRGETHGMANRRVVTEELLLLWLANRNPALERYKELFDDEALRSQPGYARLIESARSRPIGSEASASESPPKAGAPPAGARTLLDLLEGPVQASPTSLEGQLEYIRQHWRPFLGDTLNPILDRLQLVLGVLEEERKPGFVGPPERVPVPAVTDLAGRGKAAEYERFSRDASWMPRLVLLAKSTYVWLDQLSKRYRREVRRLDQIPEEELDELARRGFTGLWLIGLWERSEASRRIKHLRGQPDAVASAYALYDYRIADDLGGEEAYHNLRERAWQRGIRLASDMVPNHVGIDGRWVIEHPEWFVQLDRVPYPGYTFTGPNLASDEHVGIFLEDHYLDNSDAAVVFKRVDRRSGQERFIYHGNDGTSMPWNDTAQLDYLQAEVREAVIGTIIEVARRFPIIRFDAAMTLAKEHIQRLWYPEPGHGGAIPSRAEHGTMSAAEFERALPEEFWREVVDRVAREVPDTLLLAEAFWMMEGYFVRTLGMHRVYNSAFMNMLKREANDEFRLLVKNVLEFEPEVLGRFVNFMNNPDEDTAVAQFGKDDKYFGVCTVMATMPGLPMFGHGQVEGFEEKYGMEYRRPRLDEVADPWLVERHQREIFPLLHRRAQFAGVDGFQLYDLVSDDGTVNEDVLAYSNRSEEYGASLVLYNNRFAEANGRLHLSVPFNAREGTSRVQRRSSLFEGLGLSGSQDSYVIYRDHTSGLEHLLPADEVRHKGMEVRLGAYRYQVLLDFREVGATPEEPYGDLYRELSGRGVPSVRQAALDLRLRPLFDAFGDLLDTPLVETEALIASYQDFLDRLEQFGLEVAGAEKDPQGRFTRLLRASGSLLGVHAEVDRVVAELGAALPAWIALEPLGVEVYERFRLEQEITAGNHTPPEPYEPMLLADTLPLILEFGRLAARVPKLEELIGQLLSDERVGPLLRFNTFEGDEYFDRDAFRLLTQGVLLAGSILQLAEDGIAEALPDRLADLRAMEEASEYRVGRLPKGSPERAVAQVDDGAGKSEVEPVREGARVSDEKPPGPESDAS